MSTNKQELGGSDPEIVPGTTPVHGQDYRMLNNTDLDDDVKTPETKMSEETYASMNYHALTENHAVSPRYGRLTHREPIPVCDPHLPGAEHSYAQTEKSSAAQENTRQFSQPQQTPGAFHEHHLFGYGNGDDLPLQLSGNYSSASSGFRTTDPMVHPSSSSSGFNVAVVRGYSSEREEEAGASSGVLRIPSPRDGAAGRADFRFEVIPSSSEPTSGGSGNANPALPRRFLATPGRAPEGPLPELPHGDGIKLAVSTISDEEWEKMNRESWDREQYNSQNSADLLGVGGLYYGGKKGQSHQELDQNGTARVESVMSRPINTGDASQGAAFGLGRSSGQTSESEDDPFRYDQGQYNKPSIFLRPSREREVSSALRHLSHASTTWTRTTDGSPDRRELRSAVPPVPQISREMLASGQEHYSRREYGFTEVTGHDNVTGDGSADDQSDVGDWETIATSGRAVYSTSPVDRNSFQPAPTQMPRFDTFDSSSRLLQHPGGRGARDLSLCFRTTRDTGRPLLLPAQNARRPNGFPLDSSRIVPHASTRGGGNNGTSNMDRIKRRGLRSPYKNLETGSKYAFRDSAWLDEDEYDHKDAADGVTKGQSSIEMQRMTPLPQPRTRSTANNIGGTSMLPETPTQFDFDLIPLGEAAERQAVARANGDANVTFIESNKARPDSKSSASKTNRTSTTQKTSPVSPKDWIRTPMKALVRSPRISVFPARLTGTTAGKKPCQPAIDKGLWASQAESSQEGPSRAGPSQAGPSKPAQSYHNGGFIRSTTVTESPGRLPEYAGPTVYPARFSAYQAPHLLPREQRRGRSAFLRRSGLNMQYLSDEERGEPSYDALSEDVHLTWEARGRRTLFFYVMCFLCIIPFFPPLVLLNKLNAAISWLTNGETGSWSKEQNRTLKVVSVFFLCIWLAALVVLLVLVCTLHLRVQGSQA